MGSMLRLREWLGCAVFLGGIIAIATSGTAAAQTATNVPLVLQDFSDCTNGNVSDPNGLLTRGTVWLTRNGDGSISLKVGMTVQPDTSS
jgi:hypothetical protein